MGTSSVRTEDSEQLISVKVVAFAEDHPGLTSRYSLRVLFTYPHKVSFQAFRYSADTSVVLKYLID